jgi:hypothetical protein
MQKLLPFANLAGHAESTGFAQAALLTHCLTLVAMIVASIVWLWQSTVNYQRLLRRRQALGALKVTQHLVLLLVGPPLFLVLLYFFVVLPGDPMFARGFTLRNRTGFAFLSFFASYTTALVLGVQILNLRLLIDTHFKRSV